MRTISRFKSLEFDAVKDYRDLYRYDVFAVSENIRWHGAFEGSRYAYEHCLTLPLYHELSEADQQAVVQMLKKLLV